MSADDLTDREPIQLSALQHFAFCRRQWALIHLERQWSENARTVEGTILHHRVDDASQNELRGDILTLRGLRVSSEKLGLSGICDAVEFHRNPDGVPLAGREGLWKPYPVEYKRGEPKENDEDLVQLCAQAICLEEMLLCEVDEGSLYYGETRRRLKVNFTRELRDRVVSLTKEIREYTLRGHTPSPKSGKRCNACSLKDLCLPELEKRESVRNYIHKHSEGVL